MPKSDTFERISTLRTDPWNYIFPRSTDLYPDEAINIRLTIDVTNQKAATFNPSVWPLSAMDMIGFGVQVLDATIRALGWAGRYHVQLKANWVGRARVVSNESSVQRWKSVDLEIWRTSIKIWGFFCENFPLRRTLIMYRLIREFELGFKKKINFYDYHLQNLGSPKNLYPHKCTSSSSANIVLQNVKR